MPQKIKILHIAPHFGGGVGTVLLNYFAKVQNNQFFSHKAVCLDYANQNAIDSAKKSKFSLIGDMAKKKSEILQLAAESDIVLVHWWNHPLLYDFLVREQLPESRIIIWSHILGYSPPNNFTDKILKYPDLFIFTTPQSRRVREVQNLSADYKKNLRDIWSTGGLDRVKSIKPKRHVGFNIGYIGNLDYAKMHPDFLKMSDRVAIPNLKFIIIGPKEENIKKEAEILGIAGKFIFTGFISEEKKWGYLSTFDIFGYPLASHHYGSSDQALQEAMGAGVVPVVFANSMESYMVKNGKTGIVVKNKAEYVKALQNLYKKPGLRKLLSKNAKNYALQNFSLQKMTEQWDKVFKEVMIMPKKIRNWKITKKSKNITPKDIFLEALGNYGKPFISYCKAKNNKEKEGAIKKIKKMAKSPNWQSKTKSTVHQYHYFFPKDRYLSEWSNLMKKPISKNEYQ